MDCITSSYLAKYADLEVLTRNIKQMLRKDGLFIMHDFTYPPHRSFARIWELYLRLLQTWGVRKYPGWREIYYGLPGLLRATRWVPELIGILGREGFFEIQNQSLTMGTSAIVTARKI
jgi:demethylmenaquinone methyltransferase/2-methoxy-6-polyprenyl-1,4-benzoquinol methylase